MKTANRLQGVLIAVALFAGLMAIPQVRHACATPPDFDRAAGGATAPGYTLVQADRITTYAASRGFLLDDTSPGTVTYLDGQGTSQTLNHLNGGQIYGLRVTKVTSYSGTFYLIY